MITKLKIKIIILDKILMKKQEDSKRKIQNINPGCLSPKILPLKEAYMKHLMPSKRKKFKSKIKKIYNRKNIV